MKAIKLFFPNQTRTISVTGPQCALSCAHCGGYYLKFMETPEKTIKLGPRNFTSALISGGVNNEGWVPVSEHFDFFRLLKSWKWRLNFHVGLLPEEHITSISEIADKISFDFVVDDRTIKEVYGINKSGKDYIRVYSSLSKRITVIPHITIGLLGGKIHGEREALLALKTHHPKEIVFLVFRPTKGTVFSDNHPPDIGEIENLISFAMSEFPETSFSLGCMKPAGSHRLNIEELALRYGFSKIVLPSCELQKKLTASEYIVSRSMECCVL